MLDNLREMIEYENQTEEVQYLMLEGTDSDMVDFFIDEDGGEAEIPDSELCKILTKIPEYDEDKDLNKKLSRITEAYIPESEYLEEVSKRMIGSVIGGTLGNGVGALAGYFIGKKIDKKQIVKAINNGEINQKYITQIIKTTNNKSQLKKIKRQLDDIVFSYPRLEKDDYIRHKNMKFIDWIDNIALGKLIPEKMQSLTESYEYDDLDDNMEEVEEKMKRSTKGAIIGTALAGPYGGSFGYSKGKKMDKDKVTRPINSGRLTEASIKKMIKEADKKELKKLRKWLRDIVALYNKVEEDPSKKKKNAKLISWIKTEALGKLIPEKMQLLKESYDFEDDYDEFDDYDFEIATEEFMSKLKDNKLYESFDFDIDFFD